MCTSGMLPSGMATKKKRKCGDPKTGKSRVQSLAFSKTKHAKAKPKWTAKRAKAWAEEHSYRPGKPGGRVDETPNEYRLRQVTPSKSCTYRSVPFGKSGIRAIVELPASIRKRAH